MPPMSRKVPRSAPRCAPRSIITSLLSLGPRTLLLAATLTCSFPSTQAQAQDLKLAVTIDGHRGSGCTLLNGGGKILPELDLGTKSAPATPFTLSWQLFDPSEDGSLPFMTADFLKERQSPNSATLVKPCRVRVTVANQAGKRFQMIVKKIKVPYYWLLEHDNHVEHSAELSGKLQELGEKAHGATIKATVTDDDALMVINLAPSFATVCAKTVTFDYTLTTFLLGHRKTKTHSIFTVPSPQPMNGTVRICR